MKVNQNKRRSRHNRSIEKTMLIRKMTLEMTSRNCRSCSLQTKRTKLTCRTSLKRRHNKTTLLRRKSKRCQHKNQTLLKRKKKKRQRVKKMCEHQQEH